MRLIHNIYKTFLYKHSSEFVCFACNSNDGNFVTLTKPKIKGSKTVIIIWNSFCIIFFFKHLGVCICVVSTPLPAWQSRPDWIDSPPVRCVSSLQIVYSTTAASQTVEVVQGVLHQGRGKIQQTTNRKGSGFLLPCSLEKMSDYPTAACVTADDDRWMGTKRREFGNPYRDTCG